MTISPETGFFLHYDHPSEGPSVDRPPCLDLGGLHRPPPRLANTMRGVCRARTNPAAGRVGTPGRLAAHAVAPRGEARSAE